MPTLSDAIERYIREMLTRSEGRILEIQRVRLASRFECVPSQINYVLKTRFTPEHGYIVESRRGEGGYIRITKMKSRTPRELLLQVYRSAEEGVSSDQVRGYLDRLREESILTEREARIVAIALGCDGRSSGDREISGGQRGRILQRLIRMILSVPGDQQ